MVSKCKQIQTSPRNLTLSLTVPPPDLVINISEICNSGDQLRATSQPACASTSDNQKCMKNILKRFVIPTTYMAVASD